MPDMIFERLAVIEFTTTSSDYTARIRGPAGSNKQKRPIEHGKCLPNTEPGLFTLEVSNHQLNTFSVTLTNKASSPSSLPPTYSEEDDETIVISFQVL